MKCPKCMADNPDTQNYCGECATPLTTFEEAQASFIKPYYSGDNISLVIVDRK